MTTTTTNNFTINGIIDTGNSLIDNINTIATAATSWVTYDYTTGKWSVIINKLESSVKSFDDSNIIGNIDIIQSDLTGLYTGVTIEYPHKDLRNQLDYVDLSINSSDKYQTETENILSLSFPIINNQIQAMYVGTIELNQNRLDKIIQFSTDYSSIGLKAGDIIDITTEMYGYTNKTFRITKLTEVDADDGTIQIQITGLEYSDSIYDYSDFTYEYRTRSTGILPKITNAKLATLDDNGYFSTFGRLIGANLVTGLLDWLLSTDEDGKKTGQIKTSSDIAEDALLCTGKPKVEISGPSKICEGKTIVLTMTTPILGCGPMKLPYTITGVQQNDIDVPLSGMIEFNAGSATFNIPVLSDTEIEGETLTFSIFCSSKSIIITDELPESYELTADKNTVSECESLTFTLNAVEPSSLTVPYVISGISADDLTSGSLTGNFILTETEDCKAIGTVTLTFTKGGYEGTENIIMNVKDGAATLTIPLTDGSAYAVSAAPSTITEGESTTVTCDFQGSISNGVQVPWTITGSGVGRVTSPLSGTVTVGSSPSSITINTTDDSSVQGTTNLVVQFGPTTGWGVCYGIANVILNDNDTITPPNITTCETVLVPLTWCANYSDGVPTSVYAKSFVSMFKDTTSGTDVPTAVSYSGGSITITSTVKVSTATDRGGVSVKIPTALTVANNTPVTATSSLSAYGLYTSQYG